ncbi:phosphomannomutase/phosphoglucomutase [Cycloclasticus sp. PY97N]|uniref:phosphomannomutase/phosphoglucomutase n=1 Tax=Cycloclasticus sp. PY97N TaxID=728003 RepID=UPI000BC35111|nr:phosphomannomutase/phosphoglucomutase [Cycloclasticus sp. PY97N]ATI02519.1 phosphomannomutase/phosphoglucomutase [Cycloclasticus sp. PY97N]
MINKTILVLMLLVIALGGAGYVYLGQIDQQNIEQAEQLTKRTEKASDTLSAKVRAWRQALEDVAKAPALIEGLDGGETAATNWVAAQAALIDDIVSLRVVKPDLMQVDPTSKPPLGYATLDLIRKVESSKKAQMPEVHMMETDHQHVVIALPVLDGETLRAVMLGAFEVPAIQTAFSVAIGSEKEGFLTLKQGALKLVGDGASMHQMGESIGSVPVAGTHWRISIKRQALAAPITKAELFTYLVGALVMVLLAGVLLALVKHKDKCREWVEVIKQSTSKASKKPLVLKDDDISPPEDEAREHKQIVDSIKEESVDAGDSTSSPIFMKDDVIDVVTQAEVPQSIFRAYDIRGIVDKTLTEQGVFLIGRAIASEALSVGQQTIAIARDGRLHSLRLSESLSKGIQAAGCNVIDVGQVPTPVLYFATHQLDTQSGVMITGSHNPANYNGLKIVIAGNTLSGEAIQQLYQRIQQDNLETGEGAYQEQMMLPEYIGAITGDVRLGRMMKVVVDCGNGVAGEAAPMLLSTLGCEVIPLYCEIDGNFPNHHPDPSKPENLQTLIDKVREEEAELGLAFDGDGDRLGVVDSDGNIIWPDRQMMMYAVDVLSRQAGADIIYDVKCTRNLAKVIAKHGGKPIMSQTGHSLIKAKMKETKAELAGEMSGHIFFKERWFGFDDALYTAARLLEIVTAEFRSTAEIFAELPDSVSTPELNISLAEGENFSFVEKLQSQATFDEAKVITIDGIRVEFKDGWGLVRASNTTPSLVLRFEADNEVSLERIKDVFREQMLKINADIALPF